MPEHSKFKSCKSFSVTIICWMPSAACDDLNDHHRSNNFHQPILHPKQQFFVSNAIYFAIFLDQCRSVGSPHAQKLLNHRTFVLRCSITRTFEKTIFVPKFQHQKCSYGQMREYYTTTTQLTASRAPPNRNRSNPLPVGRTGYDCSPN